LNNNKNKNWIGGGPASWILSSLTIEQIDGKRLLRLAIYSTPVQIRKYTSGLQIKMPLKSKMDNQLLFPSNQLINYN